MSDYLERFLGVGHDPSPTARFDRLASKIQGAITHSRVGVLDFPSGRVYRRNTSLRWTGDQGLDNTSSNPYLRNSDIMRVLEYPLETINITESSTSLRRAATSLPPIPPGMVKSNWAGNVDAKTFANLVAELFALFAEPDCQGVLALADHLGGADWWDEHRLGYGVVTTVASLQHWPSRLKVVAFVAKCLLGERSLQFFRGFSSTN